MFCSKCGRENDDSAAFCSGCGASLKVAPIPVVEQSLTPDSKARSGAILSLIGAVLSIAVCLFLEFVYFDATADNNSFYGIDDILMYICGLSVVLNGLIIWKTLKLGKILSIISLVTAIVAIFISLISSLSGLANMEVICIFNLFNTIAMVLLLIGAIKSVTGAFSRGKH
jgi:hypothetical protein